MQFNQIKLISAEIQNIYTNTPATGRDDDRYVIIPATGRDDDRYVTFLATARGDDRFYPKK